MRSGRAVRDRPLTGRAADRPRALPDLISDLGQSLLCRRCLTAPRALGPSLGCFRTGLRGARGPCLFRRRERRRLLMLRKPAAPTPRTEGIAPRFMAIGAAGMQVLHACKMLFNAASCYSRNTGGGRRTKFAKKINVWRLAQQNAGLHALRPQWRGIRRRRAAGRHTSAPSAPTH